MAIEEGNSKDEKKSKRPLKIMIEFPRVGIIDSFMLSSMDKDERWSDEYQDMVPVIVLNSGDETQSNSWSAKVIEFELEYERDLYFNQMKEKFAQVGIYVL